MNELASAAGAVDDASPSASAERKPTLSVSPKRGLHTQATRVTCSPSDNRFIAWSPAGDAIIVDAERNVVTPLSWSTPDPEGSETVDVQWGPDAEAVVVVRVVPTTVPAAPTPTAEPASGSDDVEFLLKPYAAEHDVATGRRLRLRRLPVPNSRPIRIDAPRAPWGNRLYVPRDLGLVVGPQRRTIAQHLRREIVLWDFASGDVRATPSFGFSRGAVTDLAIAPDGTLAAAAGMDGIHVFEVASGQLRATLTGAPSGGPRTLAWLKGGQGLVSSWVARWRTAIELWSLEGGAIERTVSLDGRHQVLAASADADLLVLSDGTVRDMDGRERAHAWRDESQLEARGACFSSGSRLVVFVDQQSGLALLDVRTGGVLRLQLLADGLVAYTRDGSLDGTPEQIELLRIKWGGNEVSLGGEGPPRRRNGLARLFCAGEAP